jgi:hypothetical protein
MAVYVHMNEALRGVAVGVRQTAAAPQHAELKKEGQD